MNSLQALLVITSSLNSIEGKLYLCNRISISDSWQCISDPISINVGKHGITWDKKEGDGKSPAGIFPLLSAFGDFAHQVNHYPYLTIEEGLECVDDPKSKYYNQFVHNLLECDWDSSEKMWLVGIPYQLGIVVGYNMDPIIPGKGSCIFIHLHEKEGRGTAGCTSMSEKDLVHVVNWLNLEKHPILIQLPQEDYAIKQKEWQLPKVNSEVRMQNSEVIFCD